MKVVSKEVEMIAVFREAGSVTPIRFRIMEGDARWRTISVDRVAEAKRERIAGISIISYRCQSCVDGRELVYELKYEIDRCRWILFKM